MLAHELTHVVQQGGAPAPGAVFHNSDYYLISNPKDYPEREAESIATEIVSGNPAHRTIRGTSSARQIQRQTGVGEAAAGMSAAEAIGLGLSAASIARDQWGDTQGGLTWSSDQITYPKELERVAAEAKPLDILAVEFYSFGMFTDNQTIFSLHGDFGPGVMANVYFDLRETTEYARSELTFNARAKGTPYGTKEDPRIQFECGGHFNPAGIGNCSYHFVLEVNQWGLISTPEPPRITMGKGEFSGMVATGVGSNASVGPGIRLRV